MSRSEREPPRATVTLSRAQWMEIVNGWDLYQSVVPYGSQDTRWAGIMPALCRAIVDKMRKTTDRFVDVDGRWTSWGIVAIWAASVTCLKSCPGLASAMAAVVPQIVAQEPTRGVESESEREAA